MATELFDLSSFFKHYKVTDEFTELDWKRRWDKVLHGARTNTLTTVEPKGKGRGRPRKHYDTYRRTY